MGKLLIPQTSLFHAPVEKDVVYTPAWLAELVVAHFAPAGRVLDPCRGDGAFHRLLPGVEGTYNRHSYDNERLFWLGKLDAKLRGLSS